MAVSPPKITREGTPVLVYDGACAFCRSWVARWERQTGSAIRYVALDVAKSSLSPEECAACAQAIHLFTPDGKVYRGAHAVLRTLAEVGRSRWLLWLYEHVPGVSTLAEMLYAFISARRLAISRRM